MQSERNKQLEDLDMALGGAAAAAAPANPFAEVDSAWQLMMFTHRNAALIKGLDSDGAFDGSLMSGMETHSTPLLSCADVYPDLAHELSQSSQLYQDTVRQLLNKLRLFSFTQLG